jgi:transglutaminase-like putative cysteine protease
MKDWIPGAASRRWLPRATAAVATLAVGFAFGDRLGEAEPTPVSFHDLRVNRPAAYTTLIDPEVPGVAALARRLGTLEAAYLFVRDSIDFNPSLPVSDPGRALEAGQASCLGKATLLASLYRALGVPADSVRVVTGQLPLQGELIEHAWVDLEYGGVCLQNDPTDLLGVHDFLRFPNREYTDAFVQRELFCFNDQGFAAVSQLNNLRGRHP